MTTNYDTPVPDYAPPVSQLLTLGAISGGPSWPDYAGLGIGREHVSELIRLAVDPRFSQEDGGGDFYFAPIHAWRALGLLQAAEAAEPLAGLFRLIDELDDDWVGEDLPRAFGVLGSAAIPVLAAYLMDDSNGLWARVAAAHSLSEIGQRHPDARLACVEALAGQLARFAGADPELNGFVFSFLLELKGVEAAGVMQRAFAADAVITGVAGDWEDAQAELGLKADYDDPRRSQRRKLFAASLLSTSMPVGTPPPAQTSKEELQARAERALLASKSTPAAVPKAKRKRHRKRKG